MDNIIDSGLKTTIIETHTDVKHILRRLEALDNQEQNHENRIRQLELNQQSLKTKLVVLVSTICAGATFLSHFVIAKLLK